NNNKKKALIIKITNSGVKLITTMILILNDDNEVEILITTARALTDNQMFPDGKETSTLEQLEIVTHSPEMSDIITLCQKVAKTDSTVLIQGDSGTGKGVDRKSVV